MAGASAWPSCWRRVLTRASLEGWGWPWPSWSRCRSGLSGCTCGCDGRDAAGSGPPSGRGPSSGGRSPRRSATTRVACDRPALVAALSLTFNLFFFYLPSYLVTALAVPLPRALAASLAGLGLVAIAAPFLGRLSDRVGRRPLLVAGTLALLVVTLPAFLLIRRAGPFGLPLGYVLVGCP